MAGSGLVNQFIPPGPERSNIGCLAYISHCVKPVGYPVAEVPGEEHGRRDPHRPGVDIVHQLLLGAGQPVLIAVGRDVTDIIKKIISS